MFRQWNFIFLISVALFLYMPVIVNRFSVVTLFNIRKMCGVIFDPTWYLTSVLGFGRMRVNQFERDNDLFKTTLGI